MLTTMEITPSRIEGAWFLSPEQHGDPRGVFLEYYKESKLQEATGQRLAVQQANCSVSARGSVRGIHFADVPPGQAKYVTCFAGAVLDVVVDIRVGSPTFGQWDCVRLDTTDRRAVYVSEGLGHGFVALEDGSTVAYLCSTPYDPHREHGVNPFDADLAIDWQLPADELQLSAKDTAAPSLAAALDEGLLPEYSACVEFRKGLLTDDR